MFDTSHYFGFYFEIDHKEPQYTYEYRCKNEHQFGVNKGYSFCPLCGETVEEVEYEDGWTRLACWDVEEEAGLPEEILLQAGEVSRDNQKFFGLNRKLEGVRFESFDTDEIYFDVTSINYETDIENAMNNEEFADIVKKLRNTYGEKFRLRYGFFTTIM
jgi:hypothetical protein